jgi:hypothetical protein
MVPVFFFLRHRNLSNELGSPTIRRDEDVVADRGIVMMELQKCENGYHFAMPRRDHFAKQFPFHFPNSQRFQQMRELEVVRVIEPIELSHCQGLIHKQHLKMWQKMFLLPK